MNIIKTDPQRQTYCFIIKRVDKNSATPEVSILKNSATPGQVERNEMKLNCLSATVISALLMAISCFCANLGYGEYKSIRKKKKANKTEQVEKNRDKQVKIC